MTREKWIRVGCYLLGAVGGASITYYILKEKHKKEMDDLIDKMNAEIREIEDTTNDLLAKQFESINAKGTKNLGETTSNSESMKEAMDAMKTYAPNLSENDILNVFNRGLKEEDIGEEIDEEMQKKFESGKNHLLDDEEDFWDRPENNPEREELERLLDAANPYKNKGSEVDMNVSGLIERSVAWEERGDTYVPCTYFALSGRMWADLDEEEITDDFDNNWKWLDQVYDKEYSDENSDWHAIDQELYVRIPENHKTYEITYVMENWPYEFE